MSFDVKQAYHEMKKVEEQRYVDRCSSNLAIIRASTVPFSLDTTRTVASIRCQGYPPVDFFLGDNKWRVGTRQHIGTAGQLLDWLRLRTLK